MIDIKNLTLSFGEQVIFRGLNLQIPDNARIGIVGPNGAGKTTLLRVIMGMQEQDGGTVERSRGLTVGYLPQDLVEIDAVPLMDYLKDRAGIAGVEAKLRAVEEKLSLNPEMHSELLDEHSRLERRFENLGGFAFEAMAMKVLHGLGFRKDDAGKNCRYFSGGWKMRIAMAALLLSAPDVLLLDEPTNHLDTESMEWLEGWLRTHKGAVVSVSHDVRFLENTAENIADLERGVITLYPYSYDEYLAAKEQSRELLEKAFLQQRAKIARIESFVERFRYKATKAAQVQSRIKQLEKIERIELAQDSRTVKLTIPEAPASGWEVLKARNLAKRYGELQVFDGVSFVLNRGERVALVGVNGAGKSTLLRLLSMTEDPTSGSVELGHNVRPAYYSQESAQNIDYTRTVWEEARAVSSKLNDVERRNLLGAFLFSGDDIFKSASVLSGGEKARLALYKLMLEETNFLILDEPTNHLDQNTREIVERALLKYQGTLLIVSHDRHFLDALAERVLEIRNGRLYDYPGNYSWFLEKREESLAEQQPESGKPQVVRKSRPSAESLREFREAKKRVAGIEREIAEVEARLAEIDGALCEPETLKDSARVQSLMIERNNLDGSLKKLYSSWEEESLKLETMKE
ncbi:MAG: ABC-F family ATP-binding cassette domain-containing protein [Synergistaceae bacterium]|nr:ABC-F family ATP-binding cassette domain-containing protein [Synergistaceae bacterium]